MELSEIHRRRQIHARDIRGAKEDDDCSYRIVPEGGRMRVLSTLKMTKEEKKATRDSYCRNSLDSLFLNHFCEYMDLRGDGDDTASLWTSYMQRFGCVCVTVPLKYRRRHPLLFDGGTEYVKVTHPYHPFWEDFWIPEEFATKSLVLGGFPLTGAELLQEERKA